jgi:hypothetical protein
MKGCGENRSRSCKCSPTPRKMIGVCVVATLILKRRLVFHPLIPVGRTHAEMAPPPFACPSILVTMIAPKSADSLNARLCASAAWPVWTMNFRSRSQKSSWTHQYSHPISTPSYLALQPLQSVPSLRTIPILVYVFQMCLQ